MLFWNIIFLSFIAHIYGAIRRSRWPNHTGIIIHYPKIGTQMPYVIKSIEEKTCLRFVYNESAVKRSPGIDIYPHRNECYSKYLGYNKVRVNKIFATEQCLKDYYKMLMLIFQTLGLSYEHKRNDRFNYVNISYKHVNAKDWLKYLGSDAMSGYNTTTYGTSYDYGSIMHGDLKFHNFNGEDTIIPNREFRGWYPRSMGERNKESFNEYRLLNYHYCNNTCENKTKPDCKYNGYQNPNKCGECLCPYPFINGNCWGTIKGNYYCGYDHLHATTNFQHQWYLYRKDCYITIEANDHNHILEIIIYYLYFYWYDNQKCTREIDTGLEVLYRADKSVMGVFLCAFVNHRYGYVTIKSEDFLVFMIFRGRYGSDALQFKYRSIPK
uniref:ZnMc domain-containing protein n=1 Tax=Parastrongyloides trichosuri TaxID=131310 RepID=A0A0N4ZD84_PARTI